MTEQTPVENGTDVNVSVTTQTPETEPVAEVPTGVEVVPEVAPDVDPVEVNAADSEVDSDGEGDDDQELDSDGDGGDGGNEEDDE